MKDEKSWVHPSSFIFHPFSLPPMRAEIISIGDELTTGQRLDTNSQWLAERLLEIGVPVAFHTTVGDQLTDNVLVFRQACERADVIVATGGAAALVLAGVGLYKLLTK